MKTPVTFTQEQIDEIFNRPYDCVENHLRKNAADFQEKINQINERKRQFEESFKKWASNEKAV